MAVKIPRIHAKCPCGQMPESIDIYDACQGGKWAYAVGSCCGYWHLEFRTDYEKAGSDELMRLAILAWNDAPRGQCHE